MNSTSFSNCFEQLSLWQFASVSSSAGVSEHFKPRSPWRKLPERSQIVLFDVLNDEFLSGHSCLVPALLPRSHSLTVRAHFGLLLLCFQSVQFLETNISQGGSVTTPLRCDEICSDPFIANFLPSLTVKEFWKSVNTWQRYGQEFGVLFFWLTV